MNTASMYVRGDVNLIVRTYSKGTEHFPQGIRKLLVGLVHLQVHFTEVRCPIHANLHKGSIAAGNLLTLLIGAAPLDC